MKHRLQVLPHEQVFLPHPAVIYFKCRDCGELYAWSRGMIARAVTFPHEFVVTSKNIVISTECPGPEDPRDAKLSLRQWRRRWRELFGG